MAEPFGGGVTREVRISEHGKIVPVHGRMGIFGTGMGIRNDGKHTLLIPYWENQQIHALIKQGLPPEYTADTLIYQNVSDIFAGIRQTHHILTGNYGVDFSHGMKGRMVKASIILREMNACAMMMRMTTIEKLLPTFQEYIGELFSAIGTQPRDTRKQAIIQYGEHISCGRDSRGRVNPTAIMSQITACDRRVAQVIQDILAIEPKIIARQHALVSIVQYAEVIIQSAAAYLKTLLDSRTFRRMIRSEERRFRTDYLLGVYLSELETIDIAPYYRTCFAIREEFRWVRKHLAEKKWGDAYRLLTRSYQSLRIRDVRIRIERLRMQIMLHRYDAKRHPLRISQVRVKLADYLDVLSTVDETGFALPVIKEALPHLQDALHHAQRASMMPELHHDHVFHQQLSEGVEYL